MATFKIGQRVRIIRAANHPQLTGAETRITSGLFRHFGRWGYRTELTDSIGAPGVREEHLAPLTDPKADEFIERMKKLAREPAPVVERERLVTCKEDPNA